MFVGRTGLLALTLVGVVSTAQACELQSRPSTDQFCDFGEVYVGPHDARSHWGSCISAGDAPECTLQAAGTRTRACPDSAYAGPNDAEGLGGFCLRIADPDLSIQSQRVRLKECGPGGVYAGPNAVDILWGTCLYVVAADAYTVPVHQLVDQPVEAQGEEPMDTDTEITEDSSEAEAEPAAAPSE